MCAFVFDQAGQRQRIEMAQPQGQADKWTPGNGECFVCLFQSTYGVSHFATCQGEIANLGFQ